MTGALGELRVAVRRLARAPAFTGVTILLLAFGIGANTALFAALEQALRGASPYPEGDRLVMVDMMLSSNAEVERDTLPWSFPKLQVARERVRTVEEISAFVGRNVTLSGAGDPVRLRAELVTGPYFDLLGRPALLGRTLSGADEPPSEGAVAVLGHALWSERFGGDPDVVGRSVVLDGRSFEVVGVMPAGFAGLGGSAELWIPVAGLAALGQPGRLTAVWSHWLRAVGRLADGVTLEAARAELAAVGDGLTAAFPDPNGGGVHGATAVPFLRARVNPVTRLALGAASAGGVLLLLIACANVAGLLLARARRRQTDLAVRAALGAGRARLLREGLLEGMLLAAAGGAAGVLLALFADGAVAFAVRRALETSGSRGLQFLDPDALGVDAAAVAVGVTLALLTGLLTSALPLRAAARADLGPDLRAAGAGGLAHRRGLGEGGRAVLVSAQLALTLVLLAGAGLLGGSLLELSRVGLGFTRPDVLVVRYDAGPARSEEEAGAFEAALGERVATLPGVRSVAFAPCPPLAGACEVTGVRRVGDGPVIDYGDMEGILTYEVSADYFETLGIAVREGRLFAPGLSPGDPPVAVVNEAARERLFGGAALGSRIAVTHPLTDEAQAEVIGVVADVREGALEAPAMPALYLAREQAPRPYGAMMVAVEGDPLALLDAVRAASAAIDPLLPLTDATTLEALTAGATARTRVLLGLLAAFALLGLLLSAVGIYGLVSYDVLQRRRETGLRVALGARGRDVLGGLALRPALLAVAGVALGILGSLFLTERARPLLYGVEVGDPRVLAGAAALLFAVAAAAAWLPARRALTVDPAETLRGE